MFKSFKADKDAYVTNRVVRGIRAESSNTGDAGSLDLFKLYGITTLSGSANIELSRILVHFDLDPIRTLVSQGSVDITNPSFECRLRLYDVYGGQTVPSNFTVTVHPMSRSFDEGLGRDVVTYSDIDTCNFLTGSLAQGPWILSGANQGGHATGSVDYITTALLNDVTSSVEKTQLFALGTEDLSVDVTDIVSGVLTNQIPDEGFRVALTSSHEIDNSTYFVKRFASRTAYNQDFHPRLEVKFDDSVQDDTQRLVLDDSGQIFLYNFSQGSPSNLLSASVEITGSNSLLLRLETPISGGTYSLTFSGSQHSKGVHAVTGAYSASVTVPLNNSNVQTKLLASGSVSFTPIWGSLDGTVGFHTGSSLTFHEPERGGSIFEARTFTVNVRGLSSDVVTDSTHLLRVDLFNRLTPHQFATRMPIDPGGDVVRDVHYRIRNVVTNRHAVPFDTSKNSTRVSSDSRGMYFHMDASSLTPGQSYVVDILITTNGTQREFLNASQAFRVTQTQ